MRPTLTPTNHWHHTTQGEFSAHGGCAFESEGDESSSAYDGPGFTKIVAPFTANVWEVKVSVGQAVSGGEPLLVLEAMKMETPVTAPCGGTVVAVRVRASELAGAGATLVVLRTAEAATA